MPTTTYTVTKATVEGEIVVATKSKKQTAIDLAAAIRRDERVATKVTTGAGTVVFEAKARKPQKRTKPFTRVEPVAKVEALLPEGFQIPEGERVAYLRTRKGCAITHNAEEQTYSVRDLRGASVLAAFDTTRQCGRFLADSVTLDAEGRVLVTD